MLVLSFALILVMAADRLWPNATWGNCWSYCVPNWIENGGYLVVRPADGVRILRFVWVPHVFWMPHIGTGNTVVQTTPMDRSRAKWLPWFTIYFPYRVTHEEQPHNSNWSDL